MAYPEPVPELKGKDADEFDALMRNFSLTSRQKKICIDAVREFSPKEKE